MFPGYFSPERNNAFHLNIHPSQSSSCPLLGVAGAEELLLVEGDRVRAAVKSNLQAEESLAGGEHNHLRFHYPFLLQAVSREKLEMFEELARIFSEDNNAVAQRELLVRSKPMMERRQKDRL